MGQSGRTGHSLFLRIRNVGNVDAYAEKLGQKYRFLIYEYPFHTANADEQIDFAAKLLKALSIEKVILVGQAMAVCMPRFLRKDIPNPF